MVAYLAERWADEKQYEDFADYIKEMKQQVEAKGFTFVAATKRPFKLTVQKDGVTGFFKVERCEVIYGTMIPKQVH